MITLVTAGLGFLTKSKVDALQSSLKSTKNELGSAKSTLAKAQGDLTTTKDSLTAANKMVEDQKSQVTAAQSAAQAAKDAADKAAGEVTVREQRVAELTAELEKIKVSMTPGTDPAKMGEEIAAMKEQLGKAQADVIEARTLQEAAARQAEEARSQVAQLNSTVKSYRENIVTSNLRGRVLSVQQGWNFVVLDFGDRQGARVGATLLVRRRIPRFRINCRPRQLVASPPHSLRRRSRARFVSICRCDAARDFPRAASLFLPTPHVAKLHAPFLFAAPRLRCGARQRLCLFTRSGRPGSRQHDPVEPARKVGRAGAAGRIQSRSVEVGLEASAQGLVLSERTV